MRILFHAYNTYCQNSNGGVQIRLNKIKKLLEERGYECDFFSPSTTKLEDYDILHIFTTNSENYALVSAAKAKGCKIVISSTLNLWDKNKIWFYTRFINKLPILNVYKMSKSILDKADKIIAETEKERLFISKNYIIPVNKICTIPNGIDPFFDDDKSIFNYIPKEKYVLTVGRFDNNKNQLNLIKALKNTSINLVLIGGAHFSKEGKDYYEKCLDEAKQTNNIFLLGWLDTNSPLLKSAYLNAEVFVLPSYDETFGITLLEAGVAGAKLVFSNTLPIAEYDCFQNCRTFNPKNINDIRIKIEETMNDSNNHILKESIQSVFSWDSVISRYIAIYNEI